MSKCEELVLEYQQGNQDAIEQLWLQVQGFVTNKAAEYLKQFPVEYQSLKDDLIQQSFFSLIKAAERYDAEQGASFLTYFGKCIPGAFHEVVFSGRGSRIEHDPMNTALSLDVPLYENGDGSVVTMADIIADRQRGEQTEYITDKGIEDVESDDYWKSVNQYMKRLIDECGTEIGAAIYRYMLDNNCCFKDAVVSLYGADVYNDRKQRSRYEYHMRETRFRFKRKWNTNAEKEERKRLLLDELTIGTHGLRDTSLKYFREAGMSSVERAVILRNKNR